MCFDAKEKPHLNDVVGRYQERGDVQRRMFPPTCGLLVTVICGL
jgi:hypothetical protein